MTVLRRNATIFLLMFCATLAVGAWAENKPPQPKAQTGKPLTAFAWSRPVGEATNLHGMVWVDLRPAPDKPYGFITNPEVAARQSRERKKGCAAVILWKGHGVIGHPEDKIADLHEKEKKYTGPWLDHGIAQVRTRIETFFDVYREHGGRLDYLVVDYETGLSVWVMKQEQIAAILADPRAGDIKKFVGIEDAKPLMDRKPPDYQLGDDIGSLAHKKDKPYMRWNRYMGAVRVKAMQQAVYEPLAARFEKFRASNYGDIILSGNNYLLDVNGHVSIDSKHPFGTHSSEPFYGYSQLATKKVKSSGEAYGLSPFNNLRWLTNSARAMLRSSDTPFSPWVSHKSWPGDRAYPVVMGHTDFYQELIYHLALTEADDFLYWNPNPYGNKPGDAFRKDGDDLLLDACLRVLNEKFDGKKRTCITRDEIAWDSKLIVSGMRLENGRVLWRVTVPDYRTEVIVQPAGEPLKTHRSIGTWYESREGEDIRFEVVKEAPPPKKQ